MLPIALLFLLIPLKSGGDLPEIKICCRHSNQRRLVNCSAQAANLTWLQQDTIGQLYRFTVGKLACPRIVDIAHSRLHNGSIYIAQDQRTIEGGGTEEYCIEPRQVDGGAFEVIKCALPYIKILKLPRGAIFSVPVLLCTLVVLAKKPDTAGGVGNIHGKCVFNYVLALTMGYVCMATAQYTLNRSECYKERRRGEVACSKEVICDIVGYLSCYSMLAFTFWLNTMCIDLHRTFGLVLSFLYHTKEKNI